MSELTKLKQVRAGHRTHVKKLIDKAKSAPPKDSNLDDAAVSLATLEKKESILAKLDQDILALLGDTDEISKEIEDTSDFTDGLTEVTTKLRLTVEYHKKLVEQQFKPPRPESPSHSRSPSPTADQSTTHNVRNSTVAQKKSGGLIRKPKIVLKEYDGSFLKWNNFWEQFETAIHNDDDVSDIEKFTYLKSYLIGDAERAIQGYTTTKENYHAAIDTLKSRFGNKQSRISAHI